MIETVWTMNLKSGTICTLTGGAIIIQLKYKNNRNLQFSGKVIKPGVHMRVCSTVQIKSRKMTCHISKTIDLCQIFL